MSSTSRGSFSLSLTAAVVCLEKTTTKPWVTPESATQSRTCSVMSMNSVCRVARILRE